MDGLEIMNNSSFSELFQLSKDDYLDELNHDIDLTEFIGTFMWDDKLEFHIRRKIIIPILSFMKALGLRIIYKLEAQRIKNERKGVADEQ